ncbi:ATPase domain protein [Trypanosoma theileri]|uniref:ATPase domain protein n=1 Tax=Trypanosoma theileri TaxID=67003 RepID=A0A1X0NKH8_9TRYP|nr:ATPase domain protein [Trypanosoma theileri]ORC84610.1 ATPase domain protein [Trypanosoma theileri]
MRRVLSDSGLSPFFFLLCGPNGSGKSTTMRAVLEGAAAHGMSIIDGMPSIDETNTETTTWCVEKARLFVINYNLLRSHDICENSMNLVYPQGTVVFLDDIHAIDYLLRVHALSHRLELMVRRLLRSPRCLLVTSSTDMYHVPEWLLAIRSPITYQLRELSSGAARRYLRSLPDGDIFMKCASANANEKSTELASGFRTHRAFILSLCHARFTHFASKPTDTAALLNAVGQSSLAHQVLSSSDKLYGLDAVSERIHTFVQLFIGRDDQAGFGRLASLASTTGILLHGPSGCGKTALVMRLAELYSDRFFFVNCATLFSKYLGESEQRLRDVFMQARRRTPSVLVLDDVDIIGTSRGSLSDGGSGSGLDVTKRMLAALLCELDGLLDNTRILVIATTSSPNTLDTALLRQGRFETVLYVPLLSFEAGREMSLDFFTSFDDATNSTADKLSLLVAAYAEGCTAASLKLFLRELLEHQLESAEEGKNENSGMTITIRMPTEDLVCAALMGNTVLKRIKYEFCTL